MIPKRYLTKYKVNGKTFEEAFSCIGECRNDAMIEAEINTDLDDRYFGSNREIVCFTRIKTPETEKIPGLEEYYKKEEEMLKEEEIQLF